MRTIFFLLFFSFQFLYAQDHPNFLWIVCEDISPTLPMYGDSTAQTPHLSTLAEEGVIYDLAFAPVGVCAPSRSSIITGMYPTSIGTMHMRTGKDIFSWGKRAYKTSVPRLDVAGDSIREYAVVIPPEVKCFTEYLRTAGYYCTNNQKTDYQFAAPITAWDENNAKAHWRNRPEGAPFFSVFNIGTTHESRLWRNAHLPQTVDPDLVPVPPYLPDNETTRQDVARHYSNVELMDAEAGEIIRQLKEDGLYDNTIIFFYSDHGGPLPRQKREIYDSGLRVPFILKPISPKTADRSEQMISFVDLAPTLLSLAGIEPPSYMEGKAFLGKYARQLRAYIYGSSDRFDEYTDRIRIIRNERYLYVRNFFPDLPKYKKLSYRLNIPMMKEMEILRKDDKLNATQSIWFGSKTTEELYDCQADPHNLIDLATHPEYQEELQKLRALLWWQMGQSPDWGQMPEAQMIDMMWPDGKQPVTAMPEMERQGAGIALTCSTRGASLAYIVADSGDEKFDFDSSWQLYIKPFALKPGKYLYVIAERIGYKPSEIKVWRID